MKLAAGAFIAGAASRLLPASIPFRFFGAAVAYHLLAWIVLFAGAQSVPRFAGGLGWPLAALHLVTLGVLAMTAIGASLQLLPVATRQPVAIKTLAGGDLVAIHAWRCGGRARHGHSRAATACGRRRRRGRGACRLRAIARAQSGRSEGHAGGRRARLGRARVACRGARDRAVAGTAPTSDFRDSREAWRCPCTSPSLRTVSWDCSHSGCRTSWCRCSHCRRRPTNAAHRLRSARGDCAAAVGGASFGIAQQPLRIVAIGVGAVAVALHLRLMSVALETVCGGSWDVRSAGSDQRGPCSLPAWPRRSASRWMRLRRYGYAVRVLLIGGWLLTFLVGILQRIIPFLASMHATPPRQEAAAHAVLADRAASTLDPFRLPSRRVGVARVGSRCRQPWRVAFAGALVGIAGAGSLRRSSSSIVLMRRMSRPPGFRRPPDAGCSTRSRSLARLPQVIWYRTTIIEATDEFSASQVSHALDDEHRTNSRSVGAGRAGVRRAPRAGGRARSATSRGSPRAFARHIEQDIGRHFDFEERELFPRLEALPARATSRGCFTEEHGRSATWPTSAAARARSRGRNAGRCRPATR